MTPLPQLSVLRGPTRPLNPDTLDAAFGRMAATSGGSTALIVDEGGRSRRLTYGQVDRLTNQYARYIVEAARARHAAPNADGDLLVAVDVRPTAELVLVLLAVWKAGAAYVPLDRAFPGARVDHILRETQPVLLVADAAHARRGVAAALALEELVRRSADQPDHALGPEERLRPPQDDLAIVLYTSGSTGVPKGVRLLHKVILNRLQWQFRAFPYSSSETTCVFKTALTFVDSVSEVWGPLVSGLSLLVVSKAVTTDPEKLINILDKYEVERLVLVPSLLKSMLLYLEMQKSLKTLRTLRLWVCSGEVLTASLAGEFFRCFPDRQLCNFYGCTEVMGDVTYHVLSSAQDVQPLGKVPIGLPVDNTIIYLLDANSRPVNEGEVGELFVAGLNLAAGYVRNRDSERFLENGLSVEPAFSRLYKTGDFARVEGGVLVYEGRTDSQVKVRGHRVDLAEVERAVNELAAVEKAVVLCYRPGEFNQALLAFATARALVNEHQLEAMLRQQLPGYMVPQVILVESVPLLVNGKVDRQALLKVYENTNNNDDECFEAEIDYTGVPTEQMEAAKVLFEIVASVLGRTARSAISVDANFYEIGGNSLNSILTITQLSKHGYYISISDFISAIDFGEVLERISRQEPPVIDNQPPVYRTELLKNEFKDAILEIITSSFYEKADLEQWLMPDVTEADYKELMDELWEPLVEKGLSFAAKAENGEIVAVALNFDAYDEPDVAITSKLTIVFDFLESIEGPVREFQLPKGKGKLLHSFMMGTHSSLSAKENVSVMQFLEDEVLRLAKSRGFDGIFTTNTSPLTQQLGTDVYNYETLLDYQVNQYVAKDNTKPFGPAPDAQRAIVQWKPIK